MKLPEKDLPEGTPLVISAMVYQSAFQPVHVHDYNKEHDAYRVVICNDFQESDGYCVKAGTTFYVERMALLAYVDDITDSMPNHEKLREHLASGERIVDVPLNDGMIIVEALKLMEEKLKRSKKATDRQKLKYLLDRKSQMLDIFVT